MSTVDGWDLLFKRADLTTHEVRPSAPAALRPGEVRLAVERFGITTLTATYARFGDSPMRFLDIFPAPEGFGRVPVWGFARVAESRAPEIAEGSRFFGYLPMSTSHTVTPEVIGGGFLDTAKEGAVPHDWYRTFELAAPDELDDQKALIHPLYPASFSLAKSLAAHRAKGVESVLITSASCKTAIGLAELLTREEGLSAIGVTSSGNQAFVKDLGLYDSVLAYEELTTDAVPGPTMLVDFTNSAEQMQAAYRHAGAQLTGAVLVGFTHPRTSFEPPALGDPAPELFFTPAVEQQLMAAQEPGEYENLRAEAKKRFLASTKSWLTVERASGPDAIVDAYLAVLAGEQSPAVAKVLAP